MNLKDKIETWKLSVTIGREEAERLGLDKSENWTPLYLWLYGVGVFGGMLAIIIIVLLFIAEILIINYLF